MAVSITQDLVKHLENLSSEDAQEFQQQIRNLMENQQGQQGARDMLDQYNADEKSQQAEYERQRLQLKQRLQQRQEARRKRIASAKDREDSLHATKDKHQEQISNLRTQQRDVENMLTLAVDLEHAAGLAGRHAELAQTLAGILQTLDEKDGTVETGDKARLDVEAAGLLASYYGHEQDMAKEEGHRQTLQKVAMLSHRVPSMDPYRSPTCSMHCPDKESLKRRLAERQKRNRGKAAGGAAIEKQVLDEFEANSSPWPRPRAVLTRNATQASWSALGVTPPKPEGYDEAATALFASFQA